jgi:YidC/Oxa1 family membrane protein insertase
VHLLIAASWLDPIVNAMSTIVLAIDKPVNNLGWSLVILAALIRLVFWPLNTAQFKSIMKMQKIAPLMKRLQERYKDDRQKLQQETMALYREHRVNPFAGCWPMLVQYPVIIAVYYVVMNHKALFENQNWLWIGTAIAHAAPQLFGVPMLAASLAHADLVLVFLYALSMYLSVRYVSVPATDPQQAQMQRSMAIFSPLLLGFMGWKYQWPSAMVLYWFAYNAFTMGQQFYLLRRYHQPLAMIDSEHVITQDVGATNASAKALGSSASPSLNGAPQPKTARSGRGSRSKRKNKRT